MKLKLWSLFTSIFYLIPFLEVHAEDPPLNHQQKRAAGLMEIKLEVEEAYYKQTKKIGSLVRLASLHEELAVLYCMPALSHKLSHAGPPEGDNCLRYLTKLNHYDPDNPAAICIRTGIFSDNCLSAFENQFISTFYPSAKANMDEKRSEVNTKAEAYYNGNPNQALIDQYNTLIDKRGKNKGDAEKLKKMKTSVSKHYTKKLSELCKPARVVFSPSELPDRYKTPSYDDLDVETKKDNLEELLEQLKRRKPAALDNSSSPFSRENFARALTRSREKYKHIENKDPFEEEGSTEDGSLADPNIEKIFRMRYLPKSCYDTIIETFKFDPNNQDIICYYHGFYTPACIEAGKTLRRQRQTPTVSGKPVDGLQSF